MQAVAGGAQSIMLGESEVVVAGGIESMSRMPYLIDSEDARWGHKMGHFTLVDAMYRDGFTCSLCGMIMGETAELLARQYGITREESDSYALETQRRAARRSPKDASGPRLHLSRSPTRKDASRSSTPTNIPGPTRRSRCWRSSRRSSPTSTVSPG